MQKVLKPMTRDQLVHVRPVMSKNLGYDELIAIFKKAGLPIQWPSPFDETLEKWEMLCYALLTMKGRQYEEAQTLMRAVLQNESH